MRLLPTNGKTVRCFSARRHQIDRHLALRNLRFVFLMIGSIIGTFIGSQLLRIVPGAAILPLLAVILVAPAIKVWRHK